jgi:hypothetical protein
MAEGAVGYIREYIHMMENVDCDFIPNIGPYYGIGLQSAFLSNARVISGHDTTWVDPVLGSLADMDKLRYDEDNPWIDFMRRFMRRAQDLCEGDYCVTPLAAFAPSDLANALRGNELFCDLYDEKDEVHRLLAICADATVALYKTLEPYTYTPDGGFCAGGMWMPGTGMFLSEDNADLCSPETYREFFRDATQQVIDEIGGAFVHHHAIGWKVHPEIARLKNLRALEISWDPNFRRPVDNLPELFGMTQDKPLQIRCTLQDLKQHIDRMREGRIVLMVNVDSFEEAKEAVHIVRKNSII